MDVLAVELAVVIGLIAGLLPGLRAAPLELLEALRAERGRVVKFNHAARGERTEAVACNRPLASKPYSCCKMLMSFPNGSRT